MIKPKFTNWRLYYEGIFSCSEWPGIEGTGKLAFHPLASFFFVFFFFFKTTVQASGDAAICFFLSVNHALLFHSAVTRCKLSTAERAVQSFLEQGIDKRLFRSVDARNWLSQRFSLYQRNVTETRSFSVV